jgi:hypothetical protein
MAVAAYEQTPRSFVDPRNNFPSPDQAEFAAHIRAYRSFVRGTLLFVAHVAVILALLAYFLG